MERERKPISSLFGLAVTVRRPTPAELGELEVPSDFLVIARKDNGAIVAQVDEADLFGRNGNRFELDA